MLRPFLIEGLLVAVCICLSTSVIASDIGERKQMPIAFTKNMGQWDERVLFRANAGGATMWFTKEGVTYQFTRRIEKNGADQMTGMNSRLPGKDIEPDSVEQLVITAKFVGANPNPEVVGEGLMVYKCNYFIGNDPAKWRIDVPNYERITLKDIYPGIDVKYSGDGNDQEAYEFAVAPGADIAQIKVEYEGAEETLIDADGRMIVRTKWGDIIAAIKSPANGVLSGTGSISQLSEKTISFETAGASRESLGTLSVELVYSTYLGGSGDDFSMAIAVDNNDNVYVAGYTSSSDFPTLNPYQPTIAGGYVGYDAFVAKYSSSGSLVYSTYLGGESDDYGWNLTLDANSSAYATGLTNSSNFPTQNPYQEDQAATDAFVCKVSNSGNNLIYSTYLGGEYWDAGGSVAVDSSGSAYVVGPTNSSDFPTLNPYQTHSGDYDVFVTKLSSIGNSLIYSTYLGGSDEDSEPRIAVDASGHAYILGHTTSTDFPTLNPYQPSNHGGYDVFVTKLSSIGNSLTYSTYLGGEYLEIGYDIEIDASGSAYVTGLTTSSDFPTLNQSYSDQGGTDAFVTKLSSTGNNLIYSTYLGGGASDQGAGIAIGDHGNVFVAGATSSSDFPILSPYQTHQGGTDVFVTEFSKIGITLTYSTYIGGTGDDQVRGVAIDNNASVYVTGYTRSSNFPTLDPCQEYQGGQDAFVTKLAYLIPVNSFVHLTDPHIGAYGAADRFQQMIDQINCLFPRPDFVIITGDLVDNGLVSSSWLRFAEYCSQVLMPCYAVVGNHDHFMFNPLLPVLWPYLHYFSNYSVPMDGVQLVGLNSGANTDFFESQWPFIDELPEGSGLSEDTWDFMQEKLDEYPASKKVIAMHHPVLYNGSNGMFPGEEEINGCISFHRDDFMNLCRSEGVSLVLGGHTHKEMQYTVNASNHMQPLANNPPEGYWSTSSTPALPIYIIGDACNQNMAYRRIEKNGDAFEVHKTKRINSAYSRSLVTYVAGVRALDAGNGLSGVRDESDSLTMPLQAHLYDSQGHHVGLNSLGAVDFEIPGAYYATEYLPVDTLDSNLVIVQENMSILEDPEEQYAFQFRSFTSCTIDIKGSYVDSVRGEETQVFYPPLSLDSGAVGIVSTSVDSTNLDVHVDDDGDGTTDRIVLPDSVIFPYICGDADNSGQIDATDAVYLINYIFANGPAPNPLQVADVDCNSRINITDAVYLINYIFAGGPAPCAACP